LATAKKNLYCRLPWVILSCLTIGAKAQPKEQLLHHLNQMLVTTVMDDLFTPPVACRIYTYPNIAFYECIRLQDSVLPSLAGKLNGLETLPYPPRQMPPDFLIAACIAFARTGESLVGSEYKIKDWREAFVDSLRKITDSSRLAVSVDFGTKTAEAIIAWHKKDQYLQTRAMMRYVASKKPGKWQPTPIDFAPGLEPHWKSIRPMTLKKASQFSPSKKLTYNMAKQSLFYRNVMEVYRMGKKADSLQQAIAYYWDDNPNISVEQSHFNYFIHKISPAGHWIMLTRQVCIEKKIPVSLSSQAYTLAAISMFDGFISCWYEKYTTELIRPVTVINLFIDEKWEPLIQTPPFPEFTSGHAVISSAAATVLTGLFGNNFSFVDNTEVPFGIPARSFPSFLKAAEECAWSRVYGGIHYPETARISIQQGIQIGSYVLKACLLNPNHLKNLK
jgi:hypothetical protein